MKRNGVNSGANNNNRMVNGANRHFCYALAAAANRRLANVLAWQPGANGSNKQRWRHH